MPKLILILTLAIGLSACAGSVAGEAANGGEAAAKTSESDKPKKHCRTVKTTDSRLGKRVCTPAGGG